MKNNKGFTLVEILAMLLVLGIIVAITIPNITGILSGQKENVYIEDAKKLINDAKTQMTIDSKIKKPIYSNQCVIFTLDYLDKNEDVVTGAANGTYSRTMSVVVVSKNGKQYDYRVRLVEDNDGEYYGFNDVTLNALESGRAKNALDNITSDELVDFKDKKTTTEAQSAMGSTIICGCQPGNLIDFYG